MEYVACQPSVSDRRDSQMRNKPSVEHDVIPMAILAALTALWIWTLARGLMSLVSLFR